MKTLVRFAILGACGAILGGCVATRIEYQPDPEKPAVLALRRVALFYWASIPGLYEGAPDREALQAAVDAAVKAAMKGGKP